MKQKYITPTIEVDELLKKDVLLASNMPKRNGIYNIEDTARGWTLEEVL
jgi:hypothetical protein